MDIHRDSLIVNINYSHMIIPKSSIWELRQIQVSGHIKQHRMPSPCPQTAASIAQRARHTNKRPHQTPMLDPKTKQVKRALYNTEYIKILPFHPQSRSFKQH